MVSANLRVVLVPNDRLPFGDGGFRMSGDFIFLFFFFVALVNDVDAGGYSVCVLDS
jgi:hypothetical protein